MVSFDTNCFGEIFISPFFCLFPLKFSAKNQKHGLWQVMLSSKMSFQLKLLSAISGKVFS